MERKLREINGSYIITIPKQVCDLYNFKPNDKFSIEPIGINELKLKKQVSSKTLVFVCFFFLMFPKILGIIN